MTQVQTQPLATADPSLFMLPTAGANGTAFAGPSASTPGDGIAGMRWPLPPRVLPDPTPGPGWPQPDPRCPDPEPKPGSVAAIFDSLIDRLGSMLQNLLGGGGTPDANGASTQTRTMLGGSNRPA